MFQDEIDSINKILVVQNWI